MIEKFTSNSTQDTLRIASDFGKGLRGREVIILEGVLGGGKTVFVKGVAEEIGVEDIVTSPSFSIMNSYEGRYQLYHFDLYRLDDELEIEEVLQDYLYIPNSLTMIELGGKAKHILKDYIFINISIDGETRIISIEWVN